MDCCDWTTNYIFTKLDKSRIISKNNSQGRDDGGRLYKFYQTAALDYPSFYPSPIYITMSFPKFTSFLFVITSFLCSQTETALGAGYDYVCLGFESFTSNDPFEANLKELLSYLHHETPSTGFNMGAKGEGQYRVYGNALCRVDTPPENCSSCIDQAIFDLGSLCWHRKGGIIWYSQCQLKYLNADFFGQIDHTNRYFVSGAETVSEPSSFNQKRLILLSDLAEITSRDPSLYAIGSWDLEGSLRLHGMTECTRNLSTVTCKNCLNDSILALPNCCSGVKNVWVYSGTCHIRHWVL